MLIQPNRRFRVINSAHLILLLETLRVGAQMIEDFEKGLVSRSVDIGHYHKVMYKAHAMIHQLSPEGESNQGDDTER